MCCNDEGNIFEETQSFRYADCDMCSNICTICVKIRNFLLFSRTCDILIIAKNILIVIIRTFWQLNT